MNDRIKEYMALHQKLERTLPAVPKEATPQQIDQNQRAWRNSCGTHRPTAKPGDIFTPAAQPVIKRLLATVFGGPDGKQLKSSIMDENPVGIASSPSTPATLTAFRSRPCRPRCCKHCRSCPRSCEYRFVGNRLIILDAHAHVVADFIEDALPNQ